MVVINLINPAGSAGDVNRISFPRVSSVNTAIYRSLGKGQYFNPRCSNFPGIIQPDLCMHIFNNKNNIFYFIYIYTYPLSHLIYALITWSRYDNTAKIAQICRNAIFSYSRFPRLNKLSCSANVFHRATIFVDIFDAFSWFVLVPDFDTTRKRIRYKNFESLFWNIVWLSLEFL